MKRPTFVGTVFACLTLTATVAAQEALPVPPAPVASPPALAKRLTLDECLKRALASSQRLAAERHRLAAIDAQVKQVYWAPFSEIGLKGFVTAIPNRTDPFDDQGRLNRDTGNSDDSLAASDGWGPSLRFEATAVVPVFTFNKIKHSRHAIEAAREAKQAEFPRFENEIKLQVNQAFEAILGARDMLYTIEKGRSYLSKARKKVEEDLENQEGSSTEIDLIKLKVIESQVGQFEAQSREIERVGLAAMRFLVGASSGEEIDIVDLSQTAREVKLSPLPEYVERAIERRPELQALRHVLEAVREKVALRRSEFFPNLALLGGWRWAYTPGRDDIETWVLSDNYNYGPASFWFGLGLDYKLDLGLDIYKLDEAKAELAALSAEQKLALDAIVLEVSKTYEHATAMRASLDSLLETKKLVKGWIAATALNHAAGLASAKDISDAIKEYFSTMANVLKTTADLNVSLAELERVTNAELTPDPAPKTE